jgi:hypothetical protein
LVKQQLSTTAVDSQIVVAFQRLRDLQVLEAKRMREMIEAQLSVPLGSAAALLAEVKSFLASPSQDSASGD